jgi:hypothetical protein
MHRNPVTRGLAKSPNDWRWSSFVHHLTGREGPVEIESMSDRLRREQMGITPVLRTSLRDPAPPTFRQKQAKDGGTQVIDFGIMWRMFWQLKGGSPGSRYQGN